MTLPLSAQIESVLLFKGGTMSVSELARTTGTDDAAVEEALGDLESLYAGRGVRLVRHAGRVALSTAPEHKTLIEAMRRDELEGPLGRAGLETLAIVMYRGPVSRADIEYIRGVNVSSTLRSLLIRGLVERVDNPHDKRSYLYQTTAEVPAYFGLSKVEDAPSFAEVKAALEETMATKPVEAIETEEPV